MYLCEECNNGKGLVESHGPCEKCGTVTTCYDM